MAAKIGIIIEAFPPGRKPSFYERVAMWRSIVRQLGLDPRFDGGDPRRTNRAIESGEIEPHELMPRILAPDDRFGLSAVIDIIKIVGCRSLKSRVRLSHDE